MPSGDTGNSIAAATDRKKGDVKGMKKSQTLCLNFQTKWNGGKKCNFTNCHYTHKECETKAEYDALVKRVAEARESSSSDSGPGAADRKALKQFQQKFCSYGSECKYKDSTCKKDHTKTKEEFKKEKEKLVSKIRANSAVSDSD